MTANQLADLIALQNPQTLNAIAERLVARYPDKADSLQNFLRWAEFDSNETEAV